MDNPLSNTSIDTHIPELEARGVAVVFPLAPAVATSAAGDIGTDNATLNGQLTSLGTAPWVEVCFQWGLTTSYGNETTPEMMSATGSFSADLTSLPPGTYHFRARTVGDGVSYGDDMTFTINAPPVASDDSYSVDEDAVLAIPAPGVLSNDTDADSDTLAAGIVTGPIHGDLVLNSDGSFTYTPEAGFIGTCSFTYLANDGAAWSNVATVTIAVSPANVAPVASDDSYGVDEDAALTISAPGVLSNDTDVDGDLLTAGLVTGPVHGTLVLNADGSFTYTPNANFNGTDAFTYAAHDGYAWSNTATVTITVNPVSDAPMAADDSYSVDEDAALTISAPGLLGNDTDVDGDTLTAGVVTWPIHGTLVPNGDGSFTYTPSANFNGTDSFTYAAYDGIAWSNAATVTITVNSVNDAPIAANDAYSINQNTALIVSVPGVLANDSDVDSPSLNAELQTTTSHGSLTLNANGSFIYTPSANFNGTDTFVYRVYDGAAHSNTATVTITVNPVINAPVVTGVTPSRGAQGQTLTVTIAGSNFTGATSVAFGPGITVRSFKVKNARQITANIAIDLLANIGPTNVSVTTLAGTGTLTGGFTVVQGPPTVTSVSPNQGARGQNLNVTVTGANFVGVTTVSFGSGITVNRFTVISSTEIVANISISSKAKAGGRDVSVTTSSGTGTLRGGFVVT